MSAYDGEPGGISRLPCYRVDGDGIVAVLHHELSLNALSMVLPQGVYTTFRTYERGRVLRLADHLARLRESAALEGTTLSLDQQALRHAIALALNASGFPLARMRVTVGLEPEISTYIALEELREPLPSMYRDGIRCAIADVSLRRSVPRSKATRFIGPASAARAGEQGAEELLLVDATGAMLEGSASNFFAVRDGIIHTAGEGVLAGVTRGLVLSLAAGVAPVVLTPVHVDDLARIEEAFITSVSRALLPVTTIADQIVGDGRPGPITGVLMTRFAAALEHDLEPIVPDVP